MTGLTIGGMNSILVILLTLVITACQPYEKKEDHQRMRLYNAEDGIRASHNVLSREEAISYFMSVAQSGTFRSLNPHPNTPTTIYHSYRMDKDHLAEADMDNVYLSSRHDFFDKSTIIHEVTHVLIKRTYGYGVVEPHGPEFASLYLHLVRRYLGADRAALLEQRYQRWQIRYRAEQFTTDPSIARWLHECS